MDRQASLCWGQRHVWLNHHQLPPRERHELNLTISIGPEPGSTIDSLRQVFDLLVRRHEGLRSTHHIDRDGGPVQRVHPPRGRMPVACYDTTEHTPAELAALIAEFTAAEFVLDRDWPIRACIISTGSAPQRVIVVGHHTALDDWVMETLKREADELHAGILSRRRLRLPRSGTTRSTWPGTRPPVRRRGSTSAAVSTGTGACGTSRRTSSPPAGHPARRTGPGSARRCPPRPRCRPRVPWRPGTGCSPRSCTTPCSPRCSRRTRTAR